MRSSPLSPPPDLAALILHLRTDRPLSYSNHMGRAVNRLGLVLIGRSNPQLATETHDEDDRKPFTASGLMHGDVPLFGDLAAGASAWVRFTALSADHVAALAAYRHFVLEHSGSRVVEEIDRVGWIVTGAVWDDHRLPGLAHYQMLIDRYRRWKPDSTLTLRFSSATTFRSQGVNVPLPRPDLVFGSLLSSWEKFTGHRLHDLPSEQMQAFIRHHIVVSRYQTETALYRFKTGGKEIGFSGEVTFTLLPESDFLERNDPEAEAMIRSQYVWFARMIHLLGDFAYYSGVGRKTTSGMGMVR